MLKRLLEHYLLLSRGLLAAFSILLTLGLFALIVNAGRHVVSILTSIGSSSEDRVILELLCLIDLTLTGAFVMIVTILVFENFVSGIPAKRRAGGPPGSAASTSRNSNSSCLRPSSRCRRSSSSTSSWTCRNSARATTPPKLRST